MITLTLAAQAHFAKLIQPGQKIVLGTKRSGCSGLSYQLEIVNELDRPEYQAVPTTQGLPVFVAIKSLPYLKGLEVDLIKEGLQSKIVYKNPNETGQCGCGESFAVE